MLNQQITISCADVKSELTMLFIHTRAGWNKFHSQEMAPVDSSLMFHCSNVCKGQTQSNGKGNHEEAFKDDGNPLLNGNSKCGTLQA